MRDFPIPVVALGAGSQSFEEDEPLDYVAMPQGMATFHPPRLPESANPAALAEAAALLDALVAAMRGWTYGTPGNPLIDLGGLTPAARHLVNEALGQGEVSAAVHGAATVRIQETVFAGVWRVHYVDAAGRLLADHIEACAVPAVIAEHARAGAQVHRSMPEAPEGVMNAPVLLTELQDVAAGFRAGDPAHIINLTLLPLTPADMEHLLHALGSGCAAILSRGYGNCRISSTALANTWWVQYYNSSESLILNTIEVTEMPDVVPASAEDYEDSIDRLDEWIAALRDEATARKEE